MAEHTAFYPDRERRHQPAHDFTDAFAGLHDVERKAEQLQPLTRPHLEGIRSADAGKRFLWTLCSDTVVTRFHGKDSDGGNDGRRESDVSCSNDVIPAEAGIHYGR